MEKVLIIDGHNLLFRMFFGIPNKIYNKQGKVVNGVLGFTSVLFKLINQLNPTYAVVVFDSEQELTRKTNNETYKANRKDYTNVAEEDNPFSQLKFLEKVFAYLNIKFIYSDNGYEADDVIANIVLKNQGQNIEFYILSSDNDFYQLINKNVFVVNYARKNIVTLTEEKIYDNFGLYPQQYVLYKALLGDCSDNIKGITKVGKVTAKFLVNSFNTYEGIYNNINSLNASLKTNLLNEKEKLLNNINLISLKENNSYNGNIVNAKLNFNFSSTTARAVLRDLDIF